MKRSSENDSPPNLIKFQKRPEAKKADDLQRHKNIRLAVGILSLVAAAAVAAVLAALAKLRLLITVRCTGDARNKAHVLGVRMCGTGNRDGN